MNPRQLTLLQRVAGGDDLGGPDGVPFRTSAYALSNRGLVVISKRGGTWQAEVTAHGRYYLEHGCHPDHPSQQPAEGTSQPSQLTAPAKRGGMGGKSVSVPGVGGGMTAGGKRQPPPTADVGMAERRRKAAVDLVEHLKNKGSFTVRSPDEPAVAEWRRIVDFAKRHRMAPEGQRLEKQRTWRGDLQISLVTGPHPNARSRSDDLPKVLVPSTLRSPHPVVAELRDDRDRLVLPPAMRRRALLLLQALAAEATCRGHGVKAHPVERHHIRPAWSYLGESHPAGYSRRDGQLDVVIDDFSLTITLDQEFPQSQDTQKSEQLVIDVGYSSHGRQSRWGDRKTRKLEDRLADVLDELAVRAAEEDKRRLDEKRAAEQRERQWEAAMADARAKATREHHAARLRRQAQHWREAAELSEYCDALEDRIATARADDDHHVPSAREWLSWARTYVADLDPLNGLPTMPSAPRLRPDDLQPFSAAGAPSASKDQGGHGDDRRSMVNVEC